jgi:hypothetical protein
MEEGGARIPAITGLARWCFLRHYDTLCAFVVTQRHGALFFVRQSFKLPKRPLALA